MTTLDTTRVDVVDLSPAEYLKMRKDCPQEIAAAQIIPPILGKSKDFGKIRVKLATPRYEVRL